MFELFKEAGWSTKSSIRYVKKKKCHLVKKNSDHVDFKL